ncbi:MAG: AAA family ATPase [Chloroflexi bacterium]|nr:AAA family ATPase [Chloroflexota bacterium]
MTDATPRPTRFTALHLENWRNFTRADVALQQRVFLVGPNASGKSNLLDAIKFLRDVVAVGGGFQAAVGKRGGVSRLRSLAARRYPEVVVRAGFGTNDERDLWEYELRFTQDNQRRPMITHERIVRRGVSLLERPDAEDEVDPERLTQTHLEQINQNRQFRDVADFFDSVRYRHMVPQLVREPDRSIGRVEDPFGGDFLEQVTRTSEKVRQARLRRVQQALSIAVPQLSEIELWRDARGTPHMRGKYKHWRPTGAWQTEDQFSDGTLRLMGLLWAVLDGTGPLLLEEPELSLHPGVVKVLPQLLYRVQRRANRQIVCSSHSRDLLEDPGIRLDEVLVLRPGEEGTVVQPAGDFKMIQPLLDGGVSLADALLPMTQPPDVIQLALFGT